MRVTLNSRADEPVALLNIQIHAKVKTKRYILFTVTNLKGILQWLLRSIKYLKMLKMLKDFTG